MKKLAALLVLVLASVALVACGSSNSSSSPTTTNEATSESNAGGGESEGSEAGGGGSSVVELEADPSGQLSYTTEEATAKAGKVSIDFKNPQPLGHDVAIEDSGGKTVGKTEVIENSATTTTVNLKPGTYHYYCTIPGHREAGMEGTLVVE